MNSNGHSLTLNSYDFYLGLTPVNWVVRLHNKQKQIQIAKSDSSSELESEDCHLLMSELCQREVNATAEASMDVPDRRPPC